ncbi:MAG TPA: CoA transferase, partial [Reyranella sp.]|nr:CoA transferase [Reyranella sp.]
DPHVAHNRLVREMTLPNGKETRTLAFPMKISGFEFAIYRSPPEAGQHNDEVFADWGVELMPARS